MNAFLAAAMSFLAQLFDGSMGWAIVALALAVRLALLPLTLHLARKMLANQEKVRLLQPQVTAIKERLAANPQEMFKAISALYKENGAHLLDRSSLLGGLLQLPVFALLYKAIGNASAGAGSFLWIRQLAAPDVLLTALVLLLTAVSAWYFPSADGPVLWMVALQVMVTAFIVWKLASGLGLYWAASALVGTLQTLVLRIERRRRGAHALA